MWLRCLVRGARDAFSYRSRAVLVVSPICVAAFSVAFAVGYGSALRRSVSTLATLLYGSERVLSVAAILHPIHGQKPRPLTLDDLQAMREEFGSKARFQGKVVGEVVVEGPGSGVRFKVFLAGLENTQDARPWPAAKVAFGRGLSEGDNLDKARVCVLGYRTAVELFGSEEKAVGASVRISGIPFTVIGVYGKQALNTFVGQQEEFVVDVPLTTAMARVLGMRQLHGINVTLMPQVPREEFEEQLAEWLRRRHQIGPNDWDDFWIRGYSWHLERSLSTEAPIQRASAVSAAVAALAAAAIVFNVMVVVVKQRSREFGVKRALGATRRALASEVLGFAAALALVAGGLATMAFFLLVAVTKILPGIYPLSTWRFFALDIWVLLATNIGAWVVAMAASSMAARRAAKLDAAAVLRA